MEVPLPSFFVSLVSWLSLIGGIWALFERAETVASAQTKENISRWLRSLDPSEFAIDYPKTFAQIFDSIFGKRHLSFRCFFRSCFGSAVLVVIVTLIWGAIRFDEFRALYKASSSVIWLLLVFVGTVSILNLIPDYISLLESRYVIRWMTRSNSMAKILSLIGLDIFVTTFISVSVFWAFVFISNFPLFVTVDLYFPVETKANVINKITRQIPQKVSPEKNGSVEKTYETPKPQADKEKNTRLEITIQNIFLTKLPQELLKKSENGIRDIYYLSSSSSSGFKKIWLLLKNYGLKLSTPIQGMPSAGIWFYSTFLTSCWVLLYAIAGLMIVVTRYLGTGIKRLAKFLDIDGKPIRSVGFMAMLFITFIYLILLMLNSVKLIVF